MGNFVAGAIFQAFDEDGELSTKKFPELAELRKRVKRMPLRWG